VKETDPTGADTPSFARSCPKAPFNLKWMILCAFEGKDERFGEDDDRAGQNGKNTGSRKKSRGGMLGEDAHTVLHLCLRFSETRYWKRLSSGQFLGGIMT